MKTNNDSGRTFAQRLVDWQTAVLVAACVGGGLMLTVMVVGSAPSVPVQASSEAPVTVVAESVPDTTPVVTDTVMEATAPAESVPETSVDLSGGTVAPAGGSGSPAQPAGAAGDSPMAASPAAVTPAALPGTSLPASAKPAATSVTAGAPVAVVPVAAVPTAAPKTAAPTTAAPTTAAPTTAAPTAVALSYPSYSVGSSGSVGLQFDGSAIYVASVTPQPNWVFQIERNGPRSIEVKFFNTATQREDEFHATVEGGRIKVES